MNDDIRQRIVEKIRTNRISTTEVADCLGKSGLFEKAKAVNRGHHRVGPVYFAYAYDGSNWDLHEQLRDAPKGSVVLVESCNCHDRALFGSLVSKFLLLYRRAEAIAVSGPLRDAPHLIKENWPIWCNSFTPIGCFNHENETPVDADWLGEREKRYKEALAVCDDSGVVIIPKSAQTAEFCEKLSFIEEQEDIWFFCIDSLKWDTYRTVCKREYLNNPDLMSLLTVGKDKEEDE